MTRLLKLSLLVLLLVVLAVATGDGYVYSGHKWKGSEVPYYVNPANQDLPPAQALTAIQWAADAWTAQTRANIRFDYVGQTSATAASNNGRSEVMFRNVVHSNHAIGAAYRYWDGSGFLTNVDVVFFDAEYTFYAYTSNTGCVKDLKGHYVEAIGIHEFGHAIGLNHSSVTDATMVAGAYRCATWKMSLHADDIAGAEFIYPSVGGGAITLTAKPPSVRFVINWTGAVGTSVAVYIDGVLYQTTANDGGQTITLTGKGPGPFQVKVCEIGGNPCSPTVTVSL